MSLDVVPELVSSSSVMSGCSDCAWLESEGVYRVRGASDPKRPFTVVWTTLPVVSWFLPFIGHVGITDSEGVVTDFSGPFTVTVGSLMCGPPLRVWHLDVNGRATDYDDAVHAGAVAYGRQMHKYVTRAVSASLVAVVNLRNLQLNIEQIEMHK